MAGTFGEFIRWPDRRAVMIAVFQPLYVLTGWSAPGGLYPNTYTIALPRLVGEDVIPGGVYRRCVGVQEGAVPLPQFGAIADVDAHPGSWFWDEANGVLYTRTTEDANPDDLDVVAAKVQFYVATAPVVLDGNIGVIS